MLNTPSTEFQFIPLRDTVEVHLPDGRIISGPRGAPVGGFLALIQTPGGAPIVGAILNAELRELTYPVTLESRLRPVTMAEADGMLIYRRSLTFLLDTAFQDIYPEGRLTIDHSVSSGGYYCQVTPAGLVNQRFLARLERHIRELVAANLPFVKREASLAEAIAYFQAKGQDEKVRLLAHRTKDYLVLYRLGDHQDYHHGYMVPSTGYLRWFKLEKTNGGFTLRFPRRQNPTELSPMPAYPKLLATFRQYGDWLNRLGIDNVGALNDAIQSGHGREIILASEALHEQHVAEIASQIASGALYRHRPRAHIVLIAGPSSSGKTTFSKRLSVQLLSQGLSPFALEMDNYFFSRDQTPLGEDGKPDFESINALNTARLAVDLRRLVSGEEIQLPRYNFLTGRSENGENVQLKPGAIIILEGIHGLNPNLLPDILPEETFRVYVSALTQLNLDRHNRISTTDTRLIRRIVRDARERGYRAQDTIRRWESVQRGEKNYIFPYQENADVMFNSALAYELSALREPAEPLLLQVPHGVDEYIEAKRLLSLLEWFRPLNYDLIPDNSILREFLGGSILKDFQPWPVKP